MKEIIRKIKSDYHRYTGKGNQSFFKIILYLLFARNHPFNYSFWLRAAHRKNLLWPWAVSICRTNHGTPAVIGDNVYIGPNVCIVEDVHIGNNSNIGAGAVVTKDVPEGATVAGVPAKVISYKRHDFVMNKYPVGE